MKMKHKYCILYVYMKQFIKKLNGINSESSLDIWNYSLSNADYSCAIRNRRFNIDLKIVGGHKNTITSAELTTNYNYLSIIR
jgi:hypothetical protein